MIPFSLLAAWAILTIFLSLSSSFQIEGNLLVLSTNKSYAHRLASFGPRLSEDPQQTVWGRLIPAEKLIHPTLGTIVGNPHLCLPASPPSPPSVPWVVMAQRGKCSFIDKVRAAQSSGATAVIVGDNEWNGLITMYATGDTSDILIPSIFITQSSYKDLLEVEGRSKEWVQVALLPNAREGWPLGDILMLTVAFPLFLTTILYIVYLIRERRRKWLERAPQEVVDSLPSKIFYAHKRLDREPQDCAICIEDFQDEEALRILPCHHEFHQVCIDPWLLTRKRSCPICKQDICPSSGLSESTPLLSRLTSSVF